jgi:hypothetical protein
MLSLLSRISALSLLASLLLLSSCTDDTTTTPGNNTGLSAASVIEDWPMTTKDAANMMISKYGQPQGVTEQMLIWHNNGPWKRTIVNRDTVLHRFPAPHPDLLEMVINYKVPTDKYDELAMYDGSVIVERTKGEMSARCDKEQLNFLAINLAHDVITGARTIEDARMFYGQQAMLFKQGGTSDYLSGFRFTVASGGTEDPDMPL